MSTITDTAIAIAISLGSVVAGLVVYKSHIRSEVVAELSDKMKELEDALKARNQQSVADIARKHAEATKKYINEIGKVEEKFGPLVDRDCGSGKVSACVRILAEQRRELIKVHRDNLPPEGAIAGEK